MNHDASRRPADTSEVASASAQLSRRDVLKAFGASAAFLGLGLFSKTMFAAPVAGGAAPTVPGSAGDVTSWPFVLPPLAYGYDALEPHIDARTMEIHYTKHHQAYITNANKALEGHPELQKLGLDGLLRQLDLAPEALRTTLRNNVGGHANHTFFWQIIGPRAGGVPTGVLADGITEAFGSFEAFKAQFTDAAMKRFGSGWAWLVVSNGKLAITSSANQDSPLLSGDVPVFGLDVWEHAYYLKYQNRRADYVTAFWNVANWSQADAFYRKAMA